MSWPNSFFYITSSLRGYHLDWLDSVYNDSGEAAKFQLDLGVMFGKVCILPRVGPWPTPWNYKILPGFEMPNLDASFSKSFTDVTDTQALSIASLINKTDSPIALFYSGGIDSTVCATALIKNLSPEQLKKIHFCMSIESIKENPTFFEKYIYKKNNIIDSNTHNYSSLIKKGFYTITADQGDCVFGTHMAIQFYQSFHQLLEKQSSPVKMKLKSLLSTKRFVSELAYAEISDLLKSFFHLEHNPGFSTQFYNAVVTNIQESRIPIYSVHDFFWWIIFNIKYMHCALRPIVTYSEEIDFKDALHNKIINWFNHKDYQLWSLANNNNGQKIQGDSSTSYKWAARNYIYSFDKNEWYLNFKTKLESLRSLIVQRHSSFNHLPIFAVDTNYSRLKITDAGMKQNLTRSLIEFRF